MLRRARATEDAPAEPLPLEEQERVIEELRSAAASDSRTHRAVFGWLFLTIALIAGFLLSQSLARPFEFAHLSKLQGKVPERAALACYAVTVFVFGSAAAVSSQVRHLSSTAPCSALTHRAQAGPRFLRLTLNIVSVFLSLLMLFYFSKKLLAHQIFDPYLCWVPFANIGGILLANSVDAEYSGLLREAQDIDRFKYQHRTA